MHKLVSSTPFPSPHSRSTQNPAQSETHDRRVVKPSPAYLRTDRRRSHLSEQPRLNPASHRALNPIRPLFSDEHDLHSNGHFTGLVAGQLVHHDRTNYNRNLTQPPPHIPKPLMITKPKFLNVIAVERVRMTLEEEKRIEMDRILLDERGEATFLREEEIEEEDFEEVDLGEPVIADVDEALKSPLGRIGSGFWNIFGGKQPQAVEMSKESIPFSPIWVRS